MKDFDYQSHSNELDEIVAKLQSDDISVEEALTLHQRGTVIAKELEQYLTQAKNKIEKVRNTPKQ